jgi:hypothetical protein
MEKDFQKAKEEYNSGKYTLVICKDEDIIKSDVTGIRPVMNLIDSKKDYKGYSAADKIVGRAAAFLYTLLQVKNLYGETMSKGAVEILKNAGIYYEYKTLTDYIENRQKTGMCPMDEAVKDIDNPKDAYEAIRNKIKFLQSQKH